jgi:hypothetical protein
MMNYAEARPWAVAIKDEVLSRRMPPWGAVKGFGEFRNEQALTPEQLELIVDWVEGGAPEGNPVELPAAPQAVESEEIDNTGGLLASGDFALTREFTLAGLLPRTVPAGAPSFQIVVEFPDGEIVPLIWLYQYKPEFAHPFLLKSPLQLPRGSVVRGIPPGGSILLLPARQ